MVLYCLIQNIFDQAERCRSKWQRILISMEFQKVLTAIVPKDIEEQKAIAQILSDMDAEITQLETKKEKYQAIKQGMMQELLTGKTRLV